MWCVPSLVRFTVLPVCSSPPSTVKCVPSTPESASCGVSVTSTPEFTQPPGAETSVVGAVLSILTGALVELVTLPALSATVAETVCPTPSVVISAFAGTGPARPDRVSSAAQTWVTLVLYQPLTFGKLVGAALRFGAVLSTLIPLTVALAALPALSVAVPVTLWPSPSTRCCGPVMASMPESSSEPVKETVTSSLYQPAELAERSGAPVMPGAVLSMLTVAVALVVFPALSVAVPTTFWAKPSVVTVEGAEQVLRPERSAWSAHAKLTLTSVLFQPWAFWAGAWLGVMLGEDRSTRTVNDWAVSVLPALSTDQYVTVWMPSVPM